MSDNWSVENIKIPEYLFMKNSTNICGCHDNVKKKFSVHIKEMLCEVKCKDWSSSVIPHST